MNNVTTAFGTGDPIVPFVGAALVGLVCLLFVFLNARKRLSELEASRSTGAASVDAANASDDSAMADGQQEIETPGRTNSEGTEEVIEEAETGKAATKHSVMKAVFEHLRTICSVIARVAPPALWSLPYIALLIFIGIWYDLGNWDISLDDVNALSAALTACGIVVQFRECVRAALRKVSFAGQLTCCTVRDLLLIVAAAAASFVVVELPWNPSLTTMALPMVLISLVIIALIYVVLYFLGQRTGVLIAAGVVGFTVLGIAQYFVVLFRSTPIMPADLQVVGTAAAVSEGYEFVLTDLTATTVAVCGIMVCLLAFMVPAQPVGRLGRWANRTASVTCALVTALVLQNMYLNVSLCDEYDIDRSYWQPLPSYEAQGFIPSFTSVMQLMELEVPEGYTEEQAEKLQADYAAQYDEVMGEARAALEAQFAEIQPTVIVVMNESFADLSIFDGLGVGYEGPARTKELMYECLSGTVAVSVVGGGTANSEFEMLTNTSLGHIGAFRQAYNTFNLVDVDALPHQFDTLGYATTAIHPNLGTNYNRNKIYPELGFDEFITIDDFPEDAETFHAGITDAETYSLVLDLLQQNKAPQFIFDLTMQNHGSYAWNGGILTSGVYYDIPTADDDLDWQTNIYLACVDESDRALGEFVEQLRQLNRPVVLLFFGDHQPSMSPALNDAIYADDDEITHNERMYQTPYLIWTNYELAVDVSSAYYIGQSAGIDSAYWSSNYSVGANVLGALLMEHIGAPLTDYQKALLVTLSQVSAINGQGYQDATGTWHALDEDDRPQVLDDLEMIQHLNFGSKV